jgi:hypothetical protein
MPTLPKGSLPKPEVFTPTYLVSGNGNKVFSLLSSSQSNLDPFDRANPRF